MRFKGDGGCTRAFSFVVVFVFNAFPYPFVPAKAGTQFFLFCWIPACAGMSGVKTRIEKARDFSRAFLFLR
jgi:hypothetical protein